MNLVTVTYLRDVYLPDYHKGAVGERRDLPEQDAIELADKGYVTYSASVKKSKKDSNEPA